MEVSLVAAQIMDHKRDLERMLCDEMAEPKALPLALLEEITDGFSQEQQIGSGGFAVVYKGNPENKTVAVKRMFNTYMHEKEFQQEVQCLMMVKHKNIVRFLGYCADTQGSMARFEGKFIMADVQQRLLCFEYLPKGSLHEYITDPSCGLRWIDRYQIITGICQGLHYLHQKNIVHFDLKPANILLDDNLVPQITDFGISRCFDEMQSRVITKISGTPGYLAPESYNNTGVTYRQSYLLDIYSLGVVITEILTGEKGYHDVDDVVEIWSNVLEKSQGKVQLEQVRVCAEIGIECTKFNPAKRPDTHHIISRLGETKSVDGYIETGMITSQQNKNAPNEEHLDTPISPGQTSSKKLPNVQSAKAHVQAREFSGKLRIDVVTGAMGTLLPMLGDLLKEYNLKKNTRAEIKFLKTELESMETALIKISEAPLDQPPDIQVKLWARDVRDLSYEIEDSVDRFHVNLECQQQKKRYSFMGFIQRSMHMLTKGKIQHKINIDIKDIKEHVKGLSERLDRYKVDSGVPIPTSTSTDSLRQLAFFQKETELIGIEYKRNEIIRMLIDDEVKQLKMVSIYGIGGLGKTSLANAVYKRLRKRFECDAFVSVSFNPNMEKFFKSLLYQLHGEYKNIMDESAWSEIQLISKIRDFLQNKSYLILIDDIWDKSVWKKIRCALIENYRGCIVIATTRILDVAKEVGGVYQLEPLLNYQSTQLFQRRIFGAEDEFQPTQLAEVSDNILRKCGGVPLAIITMASVLAGKKGYENTYMYWSKVYQSMGSGLENHPDLTDMRNILYVSYYNLPPKLKACLLYLSLYPEDYIIKTKELIWKWIGEGFVHEEQGKSLYEVGEAFFDELINKSLIEPMDINIDNKASSCRIHFMVLDLISSLSNEENFLTLLGGQHPRSVPSKVRRLSLQASKEDGAKQTPNISLSSVRSLTVFAAGLSLMAAISGFRVLRTLDLSGCADVGNHHMKDICNLLHLRYLSLRGTSITNIPKEIGRLQLLQVLDIRSNTIKSLPSTFDQLRQLALVDIGNRVVSTLLLRSMLSLSSLSSLAIRLDKLREENLQVLGSMLSLRDLSIHVVISRQGGEKKLVIENGCPFQCLTRLHIESGAIDFVFTQGNLQMLQTLQLDFDVKETKDRFGFHFGLENLPSLEQVYVVARGFNLTEVMSNALRNSVQKALNINPNKPTLTLKALTDQGIVERQIRMSGPSGKEELSIEE